MPYSSAKSIYSATEGEYSFDNDYGYIASPQSSDSDYYLRDSESLIGLLSSWKINTIAPEIAQMTFDKFLQKGDMICLKIVDCRTLGIFQLPDLLPLFILLGSENSLLLMILGN